MICWTFCNRQELGRKLISPQGKLTRILSVLSRIFHHSSPTTKPYWLKIVQKEFSSAKELKLASDQRFNVTPHLWKKSKEMEDIRPENFPTLCIKSAAGRKPITKKFPGLIEKMKEVVEKFSKPCPHSDKKFLNENISFLF